MASMILSKRQTVIESCVTKNSCWSFLNLQTTTAMLKKQLIYCYSIITSFLKGKSWKCCGTGVSTLRVVQGQTCPVIYGAFEQKT